MEKKEEKGNCVMVQKGIELENQSFIQELNVANR
jgi:hypothetical protein